jgi:hypothetical protein
MKDASKYHTKAADAMEQFAGALELLMRGAWPNDPPYCEVISSPYEERLARLYDRTRDVYREALSLCADLSCYRDHLDRLAQQAGETPSLNTILAGLDKK